MIKKNATHTDPVATGNYCMMLECHCESLSLTAGRAHARGGEYWWAFGPAEWWGEDQKAPGTTLFNWHYWLKNLIEKFT